MSEGWQPSATQLERIGYRRRQSRRRAVIAAVSTGGLVSIVLLALTSSPGWPRFRETYLNFQLGRDAFPDVLRGLWLNVRITVICAVIINVLGVWVSPPRAD